MFLCRSNPRLLLSSGFSFGRRLRRFASTQGVADQKEATTDFGFQEVPIAEKAKKVETVFHNVAEKYDLMNDVMSFGIHRLWKQQLLNKLQPMPGINMIDVAGGTGDISFLCSDFISKSTLDAEGEKSRIVVIDYNSSMLRVGKARAEERNIPSHPDIELHFVEGDAHQLPVKGETVDLYSIAFGLRNCTHIQQVLNEAYRVLRPGGRFVCLEFSQVESEGLRYLYDLYSFEVIPILGEIIAQDMPSYQYLVESIRKFPAQKQLCDMVHKAGFKKVSYESLTGGVVAIHSGFKL